MNIVCRREQSFTLIELLITMVVSALVINGVIMSIVNSMVLNEYNQEFSIAMNIARAEIESAISQKTSFSSLTTVNRNLTLAADGLNGCVRRIVTSVVPGELANVQIFVCWRGRGNRQIGNCVRSSPQPPTCLAGTTTSPCTLETAVARR